MGLDTTHGCWHGAYSAFFRWRNEIARAAGYAVLPVKDEIGSRDTVMIDWGHIESKNYMGEWDAPPSDPLIVLIAHSDCEGVIKPEHAGPLADRLESLIDKLPTTPDAGHIGDWKVKTKAFVDGLRLASSTGESVEFH